MSEDRGNPPTGNSPPDDDLRSLIAGITTESKGEAPPPAPEGGQAANEPPAKPPEGGRAPPAGRGADGRFLSAGEPPPSEPERKPPAEPPARPAGEPPAEGGEKPPAPKEPPQPAAGGAGKAVAPEHWSAGDKAVFNAWQEPIRDQFLTMYKRMEGGFTQRLQRGADLERGYGEVEQLFAPYRDELRQLNRTPAQVIKSWHDVEKGLRAPQMQDEIIARIINNYKADPAKIAGYLNQLRGFAAPQPGAGDGGAAPPRVGNGADPGTGIHPALAARLDALEADRTERVNSDNQARLQTAQQQIEEFANAKDADGNLLHPLYAELEGEMMQLAYADRAAGRTPVIKDLYERAAWANPVTRDKLQASQREAEDKELAAARKAKAEAAQRAGSSVTGAPSSGQVPNSGAPDRSIRDEIKAQMAGRQTGRV
jgi:hypothetical protein